MQFQGESNTFACFSSLNTLEFFNRALTIYRLVASALDRYSSSILKPFIYLYIYRYIIHKPQTFSRRNDPANSYHCPDVFDQLFIIYPDQLIFSNPNNSQYYSRSIHVAWIWPILGSPLQTITSSIILPSG